MLNCEEKLEANSRSSKHFDVIIETQCVRYACDVCDAWSVAYRVYSVWSVTY